MSRALGKMTYVHINSIASWPDFSIEKMNVCIVFQKSALLGEHLYPGWIIHEVLQANTLCRTRSKAESFHTSTWDTKGRILELLAVSNRPNFIQLLGPVHIRRFIAYFPTFPLFPLRITDFGKQLTA